MAHQQLEKTNGFRWFLVLQTWEVATLCLNLWRPMHECHFSSKRSESVGSLSSCFWAGFRIMFQLGIILELDAILWPVVQIKIAEAQLITAAIVANATQSLDIWPSPRGLKSSLKKNCANTITTDWAVNQSIHKQQLQVRCGNCLSKYCSISVIQQLRHSRSYFNNSRSCCSTGMFKENCVATGFNRIDSGRWSLKLQILIWKLNWNIKGKRKSIINLKFVSGAKLWEQKFHLSCVDLECTLFAKLSFCWQKLTAPQVKEKFSQHLAQIGIQRQIMWEWNNVRME